jgi:SAM-dependent methyltransferase
MEVLNDRFKGVDFTAPVSKEIAGTENYSEALYYASSGYVPEIKTALNYLKVTANDAIIDYGCGKGAVLVKFAEYPFKRIAGIELSESLSSICRTNMNKLGLDKVEIITGDATAFKEIDDLNFFYFFNPFSGKIFEKVIDNIIESTNKAPRKVSLLYYHPTCHDSIMKTGKFSVIKSFIDGARQMNIYQNI